MSRLKIEALIERVKRSRAEIEANRSLLEDADEYTNPFSKSYLNSTSSAQTLTTATKSYDSTAMIASNNFVNTMVSKFTPPFQRWAELHVGPAVPEDKRDNIDKVLEKITEIIFANLAASNFNTAAPEMYRELGKGTGILFCLEGDETMPLNFLSAPIMQMGFLEGKNGTIDFIVRQRKIKYRLIKETWRKADISTNLSDAIRDKPDDEIEVKECFYYDYDMFIWHYEVLLESEKEVIYHSTSKTCPVIIPRWMKIPGFAIGVGPVLMALPDIKTLNKMKELSLRLAALSVFGVYTVINDGVFNPNTVKIKPGAFIAVQRNGGPEGRTIEPLPKTGDFQVQEFMLNDLKDQIRQIMLDNRLPQENGPVRSALEIAERVKTLATDIGASYGRLIFEYVIPLFRRMIEILEKKGLLVLPKGFDIDSFFVQVQVLSPIAQQQSIEDVQKFVQAYQMVAGIDPALAELSFMLEDVPAWICEKIGSPGTLLRDDTDKQELKDQIKARVAEKFAQLEAQQMGASTNG